MACVVCDKQDACCIFSQENQREGVQHQPGDKSKDKTPPAKSHPAEKEPKKGQVRILLLLESWRKLRLSAVRCLPGVQKAEKVSGKKSKVPVQLDIGNMLATLEKKQQSQKAKKPVILSGGSCLLSHQLRWFISDPPGAQPGY